MEVKEILHFMKAEIKCSSQTLTWKEYNLKDNKECFVI